MIFLSSITTCDQWSSITPQLCESQLCRAAGSATTYETADASGRPGTADADGPGSAAASRATAFAAASRAAAFAAASKAACSRLDF